MARAILFVKTSSLGDVIHNMPAVTDARRRFPNARIEWAVEEAYAPLVGLHPGVDRAVPVAIRRWRKSLGRPATWGEVGSLRRALGAQRYDAVIDTQGLLKSAFVARLAVGVHHGFDRASAREPLAARFYDRTFAVDKRTHAVTRCRLLAGHALGYVPEGPPDYGLAPPAAARAGAAILLLHGTARAEKAWPEAHWRALAETLVRRGHPIALLHGTPEEAARSARLAEGLPGAVAYPRLALDGVAAIVASARAVIGVDTGLVHLAAAYARPIVALFGATDPALTGPIGAGPIAVVGGGEQAHPDAVLAALDRVLGAAASAGGGA